MNSDERRPDVFQEQVVRRICCVIAAMVFVLVAERGADAMEIAKDGKAKCVIVTADEPTAAEQTAAGELAEYLKKVTGGTFPVRKEKDATDEGGQILVGWSQRTKAAVGKV